jgi:2-methylcitrate dehydratase PrpD
LVSGAWADTLAALGAFAATLDWPGVDRQVRERLELVLLDTVGVTIAGARTPELRALVDAWDPPPGPAVLMGAGRSAHVDAAVWLNGTAACCLELDEGNKYVRGHPAAHAFPAVLALAQSMHVTGAELCAALLVGHEVASRFGRAFSPAAGLHPHGHWGATGAAAASARLLGADADRIAGAIDAACGLPLATHFDVALQGTFVRNTWIGAANANGLVAARLGAAGLAGAGGTPGLALGSLLGSLDADTLTEELGDRFDVTHGYFKRHASCSYTHPPADAVLALRSDHPGLGPDDVVGVEVSTHRLAAPLAGTVFPTRLAAMFSVPYVVAAALTEGACTPAAFDEAHRTDPTVLRLAHATSVRLDPELDARLPAERPARVVLRLVDGSTLTAEAPNPIGDADHHPFGHAEVAAKLAALIGDAAAEELASTVAALPAAEDVTPLLEALA